MNKVILIGRVTKAIELKKTTSGKSIANFTLAVNRDYKNAEGNYDADFINCVVHDAKAETISRYVGKGDKFGIEGQIRTRTYDDKNGNKVYVTEVKVDSFEFLESKKDKPSVDIAPDDFEPFDDGDLPFN